MMALQLKNGDATYYQSPEYCRNYTSPPVSYGDSSHYLARLPGPYYNPRPRQRIPRDLAMCVTPSGQFYCSMCNCGAEQETDFRQHHNI